MSGFFEYCLFGLMCACVIREVCGPVSASTRIGLQITSPLEEHHAWLEHIGTARQQNTLGPLRLEMRAGSPCVVGMGHCQPVESVEHGITTIKSLKDQIAALF